ncbi:hypothetical protein ATERTT37_004846 [Aspergillus terreus]
MEHLKRAFAQGKQGSRPALVTYVTAGFPTPEETPAILLGMQAGGSEAGVNGFIIVDLPPEEAVRFRNGCTRTGLSYVPLIAPSTTEERMKLLCGMADSFIYLVSRMGVTGAAGTLNNELPDLIKKVKYLSGNVPIAVGFGISTREQFLSVTSMADGAVIGSKIITTLFDVPFSRSAEAVEEYCMEIKARKARQLPEPPFHLDGDTTECASTEKAVPSAGVGRFGGFGGQYVPEALTTCLAQLEKEFDAAINDPEFWNEFRSYYEYLGRPSSLHLADRLTQHTGGANIWLKREDLNHTGSHKINNALGQVLIARRLGKTEIIAETGAGQHGVATAALCAKLTTSSVFVC